jgi:hypothetical protein
VSVPTNGVTTGVFSDHIGFLKIDEFCLSKSLFSSLSRQCPLKEQVSSKETYAILKLSYSFLSFLFCVCEAAMTCHYCTVYTFDGRFEQSEE